MITSLKMKVLFYKLIPEGSLIRTFYRRMYWRYIGNRKNCNQWKFDVVRAYSIIKENVFFVQIGSNNGINGDPIHDVIKDKLWKGILIEPVPYLFDKLKEGYLDYNHNLIFENVAISEIEGEATFFRLKESSDPDLPIWYDQIGSFNKEVILKHKHSIPNFDNLLINDVVNTITFNTLIEKYNIKHIDFLHIDTEGYDLMILKLIDFSKVTIDFIMFEHKHLNKAELKEASELLKAKSYIVNPLNESDTVALTRTVLKEIEKTDDVNKI